MENEEKKNSEPILRVEHLVKNFGTHEVLKDLDFVVNKGEVVCLLGPNGAGKTTLFKLILKEEEPTLMPKEDKPGDISILSGIKVGYLNQDAIKDVNHSVKEELELAFSSIYKKLDEFNKLTEKMSFKHDEKTFEEYNTKLDELNDLNAFNLDYKIEEYLSRFHFPLSILDKKVII